MALPVFYQYIVVSLRWQKIPLPAIYRLPNNSPCIAYHMYYAVLRQCKQRQMWSEKRCGESVDWVPKASVVMHPIFDEDFKCLYTIAR